MEQTLLSLLFLFAGFLEKNKDSFSQDLRNLVVTSQLELLANIFKLEPDNKNKKTLSSQFRTSLDILMKNLSTCQPFFVRCIKPNEFKKPRVSNFKILFYFLSKLDRLFHEGTLKKYTVFAI